MPRDIVFQAESLATCWDEALPLAKWHYRESALDPGCSWHPQRDLYARIEEAGGMRCFTARVDGVLAGYAIFLLSPNPHCAGMMASQDAVYLTPSVRRGWTALRFLRAIDERLAAEGITVIRQHARRGSPLEALLRRRQYREVSTLFSRELAHG